MIPYLTILPLVFVLSSSDIRTDHQLHYVSSFAIQQVAYALTDCPYKSFLISLSVGAAKELIHDKLMGRGNAAWKDMRYNALGAASGLVFTLSIRL